MNDARRTLLDSKSHEYQAIMFVDICDSTSMKENTPEANWVNTYIMFYDLIRTIVERHNGTVVKYLGDGILAAFGDDQPAVAINAAIKMQEEMSDANMRRKVDCKFTIGIAYGEVVRFDMYEQGHGDSQYADYIGTTVDAASRLSAAATAQAILVDRSTVSAAAMPKVKSAHGETLDPRRSDIEYQGDEEALTARGFNQPIKYYEIFWSSQRFGLKASAATTAARAAANSAPRPESATSSAPHSDAEEHRSGTVKMWNPSREMGFIESTNEDFYFNTGSMVKAKVPETGTKVFFVPRPAIKPGSNRVASCVCFLDEKLSGKVVRMGPKDFGFVQVTDSFGVPQTLFMYVGKNEGGIRVEDTVHFTLSENSKGVCAYEPTLTAVSNA